MRVDSRIGVIRHRKKMLAVSRRCRFCLPPSAHLRYRPARHCHVRCINRVCTAIQCFYLLCHENSRLLIGPPVGGALYNRFGFRGPFIFGILVSVADLLGRILLIERRQAVRWGVDPAAISGNEKSRTQVPSENDTSVRSPPLLGDGQVEAVTKSARPQDISTTENVENNTTTPVKSLSLLFVIIRLAKSTRALNALFITLTYG